MLMGVNQFQGDNKNSNAFILFCIGLFSMTQINIGGKIGLSELAMVLLSPFLFLKAYRILSSDKVLYFFVLILLWLLGAIFIDIRTGNYLNFMMRGLAVPITVFGSTLSIYILLRKNPENLKWILLGMAISGVVSVFVFQRGRSGDIASEYGMVAGVQSVVGYKLFWVTQAIAWLTLPITGWYNKINKIYILIAMPFLCGFALYEGGRSLFMTLLSSLLLLLVAGRSRKSIEFVRRHFVAVLVIIFAAAVAGKFLYQYASQNGYLGAAEERKYRQQTSQGDSAIKMLMAGRSDFFIGLLAALDAPLCGHGSVALDTKGYVADFLRDYGDSEDYYNVLKMWDENKYNIIPAHSHIICYWMWHGIFALAFWVAVLVLVIKTISKRVDVIPAYYGYLVVMMPGYLWDYFFSPFDHRVYEATLFAVMLLISKISRKRESGLFQ